MRTRTRDFILTQDDLFFATTSYLHPEDRILSFLRYIPDSNGDRLRDGKKYSKVDTRQAYEYLDKKYPEYLYNDDINGVKMMGVPLDKIQRILKPEERLKEIMEKDNNNDLLKKVVKLAYIFNEFAYIPFSKMGISGSILPELYDPTVSDLDFVIYGLKNHKRAMETFREIKDKSDLKSIGDEYWMKLYEKRIKDSSLSYEEFQWYEKRKNNRGVIDGTLFDILATRDWDEIKGSYGEERYKFIGDVTIQCRVKDAIASFDNPAVYKVENVSVLDGQKANISEIASFTHTYAGQAKDGEEIIAKGKLEKVTGKNERIRLVVGTTREAFDEYIKLAKLSAES